MKRMIMIAAALACATLGFAQEKPEAGPRSEWLPSFVSVVIDAPLDITLVPVPESQAPKIVYDTQGSATTKFRAEVKDRVLRIRERPDSHRTERTSVTVYYNTLHSAEIFDAAATFADTLAATVFDMTMGGNARVAATLDIKDLSMEVSGRSKVTLAGTVRYLSLFVATARVDAAQLVTMSAEVNAQSNSEVLLHLTDRLKGRTSTGGTIRYKGSPSILRTSARFMAGDIVPME